MAITKYIGRIALLGLIGMIMAGSSSQSFALAKSTSLSLPGLSFDSSQFLTNHPQIKTKPTTITLSTVENPLKIKKTNNGSLADMVSLTSLPQAPKKEDIPIIQQVFAAEITQTAVTETPTPSPTASPSATTSQNPVTATTNTSNGGLNADTLFTMINSYRAGQNLPAFQKNDQVCTLAAARAPEITNEIATGTMHAGMYGRNLPYWNTENIISMSSETQAFTWWINDPIHHAAIVSPATYSCVACSGNACAEEFTSLQPK